MIVNEAAAGVLVLATLASRIQATQPSDREIGAIAAVTLRPAEPVLLTVERR